MDSATLGTIETLFGRGDSNTPLPTVMSAHSRSGWWSTPVVCDTVNIRFLSFLEPGMISRLFEARKSGPLESVLWTLKTGTFNGYSGYEWISEGHGSYDAISVLIGPPEDNSSRWRISVHVGSRALWDAFKRGLDGCAGMVGWLLDAITGDIWTDTPRLEDVHVSRLDICADHGGYAWKIDDLEQFAKRGPSVGAAFSTVHEDIKIDDGWIYRGTQSLTLYLGKRGGTSRFARIYDKIIEAQKTGKLGLMLPIWREAMARVGINGDPAQVFRVEIEHGGGWLAEHGVENASKLRGIERKLWIDYCKKVRHTVGCNDQKRHRKSSEVWRLLTLIPWIYGQKMGDWSYCTREKTEADAKHLLAMATGCVANRIKKVSNPCASDAIAAIDAQLATMRQRLIAKFFPCATV